MRSSSADSLRPELHADPGPHALRGLGDGVLPRTLAGAAHDEQIAVAEREPPALPTAAWAQVQVARRAERDDRDHRVGVRAAPDRVTVPGDAVAAVPVQTHAGRHEPLS